MVARALAFLCLLGCAPVTPRAAKLSPVAVSSREGLAQLPAVAAGRPLVVDFFASWCKPCRESIPELVELRARERDLLIIGIAVGEGWDVVQPFVDELGVTYPVYVDPDFAFSDAMGERSVPSLLVIDGQGRVVHRGRKLDAAARAAIAALK